MKKSWFRRMKDREHAWRDDIGGDISTPEARKRARFHFNWVDHAILRKFWHNFYEIAPGVYRANQPSPERLAYYKSIGIKSILNLRGVGEHSNYLFEEEACENLGLNLTNRRIFAADLASRDEYLAMIDAMETIEKPVVIHCKSGSDRSGFAAILYLHFFCGVPLEKAMPQLSWKYYHLKRSKNGILDLFFDAYVEESAGRDISLIDWIKTEYEKERLVTRFESETGRKVS